MRTSKLSRRAWGGLVVLLALAGLMVMPAGPAPAVTGDLVPGGLRVDFIPGGNGVIEPGDFPVVAPSWGNISSSPVTATGTASNFTGPPGATYGFLISNADYGTIPGSSVRSCWEQTGDCYVLSISDPATRPTFHWDATVLETLSTGETKTWTLHIGRTFRDVSPTGSTYPFIETLVHNGITFGCNTKTPPYFCPKDGVTREQMAAFIIRAIEGPGYTPPHPGFQRFSDVPPANPFYAYIEQMAARGITAGCATSPPRYCPTRLVTREQMAKFVIRGVEGPGYNPPAPSMQRFVDVPPSNPFYAYIEQMAARGITAGCDASPPRYCPTASNTREQMAVFLTRGFDLVLYGP